MRRMARPRLLRPLLWALLLAPLRPAGADMTPAQAFSAGKDFGGAQSGVIGAQVNDGRAQAAMPEYHDSAPASTLFQGGQGALFAPGQSRKDFCATPGGPLADRDKYDCDASNLLSGMDTARGALQINRQTDPLLNDPNRAAVKANPEAYIGTSPAQSGTGCVERSISDPGQSRIEICNQAFSIETATCQKVLTVAVTTAENCTPGTWLEVATAYRNAIDQMHVQVLCEPTRSDGLLQFRFWAHGGEGACIDWQNATLSQSGRDGFQLVATLSPNWEGSCTRLLAGVQASPGCVNGTCNYSFTFGSGVYACPQGGTPSRTGFGSNRAMSCILSASPDPDTGLCPAPTAANGDGGCVADLGAATLTGVSGWSAPASFAKPAIVHVETDTWDNQCAGYEARQ